MEYAGVCGGAGLGGGGGAGASQVCAGCGSLGSERGVAVTTSTAVFPTERRGVERQLPFETTLGGGVNCVSYTAALTRIIWPMLRFAATRSSVHSCSVSVSITVRLPSFRSARMNARAAASAGFRARSRALRTPGLHPDHSFAVVELVGLREPFPNALAGCQRSSARGDVVPLLEGIATGRVGKRSRLRHRKYAVPHTLCAGGRR